MNRVLKNGHFMLGFTFGFTFALVPGNDSIAALRLLGYFAGVLVLNGIWQWFEKTSHRRHLERWDQLAQKGRWKFIFTRYILARGIVVLLLLFFPVVIQFGLGAMPTLVLFLTVIMGLSIMTYLGYQEWSECDQEFRVRTLEGAAERAKQ